MRVRRSDMLAAGQEVVGEQEEQRRLEEQQRFRQQLSTCVES
jgi:hypothetical protein